MVGKSVYLFSLIFICDICAQEFHEHRHFEHDPRVPLRTIKCLECYETSLTKGSACSRTRYCEDKWCVRGPDKGGMYRGCMHMIPYNTQVDRCYNITGEDGTIRENCYCNSRDFCNSARMSLAAFPFLVVLLRTLLLLVGNWCYSSSACEYQISDISCFPDFFSSLRDLTNSLFAAFGYELDICLNLNFVAVFDFTVSTYQINLSSVLVSFRSIWLQVTMDNLCISLNLNSSQKLVFD